jgi:hypothetical protein
MTEEYLKGKGERIAPAYHAVIMMLARRVWNGAGERKLHIVDKAGIG